MLTAELINTSIPRLQLQDTVGKALRLINDFRVTHLPVVSADKYLGMVSENDLLDKDDSKATMELLQEDFLRASIKENVHFLTAVNFSNQFETTIVPIANVSNDFIGVITLPDLLKTLGNFSGATEIGGIIVMEMERVKFSISEISRIVESNEATLLHLNTTTNPETGLLTVTLHLNKKEISAILASFERYEYDVIYDFSEEKFEDNIDINYKHLMNYLDI